LLRETYFFVLTAGGNTFLCELAHIKRGQNKAGISYLSCHFSIWSVNVKW